MPYARKSLVSLDDTPYYHVVGRYVRRAWLWGYDEVPSAIGFWEFAAKDLRDVAQVLAVPSRKA